MAWMAGRGCRIDALRVRLATIASVGPAVGIGKLLLVKARVQGGNPGVVPGGYGRSFTTVSRHPFPPQEAGHPVEMQGAQGAIGTHFAPDRYRLTSAAWH